MQTTSSPVLFGGPRLSLKAAVAAGALALLPAASQAQTAAWRLQNFAENGSKEDLLALKGYNDCFSRSVQEDLLPEGERAELPPERNLATREDAVAALFSDTLDFGQAVQDRIMGRAQAGSVTVAQVREAIGKAVAACSAQHARGRELHREITEPRLMP